MGMRVMSPVQGLKHRAFTFVQRYFKELGHVIVEAGPSKICRPANRGKLVLQFESKGNLEAESPLSWRRSIFFLLRPSVGLIGPTHVMVGDLLFPKSIDSNVNLI